MDCRRAETHGLSLKQILANAVKPCKLSWRINKRIIAEALVEELAGRLKPSPESLDFLTNRGQTGDRITDHCAHSS
jgi:hypothetical protein